MVSYLGTSFDFESVVCLLKMLTFYPDYSEDKFLCVLLPTISSIQSGILRNSLLIFGKILSKSMGAGRD